MPRSAQKARACCSNGSAAACSPWCTCSAVTHPGQARWASSSSAVESAPPLKATARRAPGSGSQRRRQAVSGSALGFLGVGEAPVAIEAGMTAVEQFLDLEVGDLTGGIAQRALEEGSHLLGVAVRATHGLVDDLVDQAQGLEAVG